MATANKDDRIAAMLKDLCPPVTASAEFKESLLKRLIVNEQAKTLEKLASETKRIQTQDITVVVHLESDVLTGSISLPDGIRLSDFLNTAIKFLKLTEVSISSPDGSKEEVAEIHVNKEAIKMLRTLESDAARGAGSRGMSKSRSIMRKMPVRAAMRMADYELSGSLHCQEDGIPQLLEQEYTFLPCTEVNIRDLHTDTSWHAGFAAVNRRQVCSLRKTNSH